MNVRILITLICTFNFFIGLSAQTYLAYNVPENNKKGISVDKELPKNIVSEKTYRWEFLSAVPKSFDEQSVTNVSEHDFGKKVACLKKMFNEYYITKEDVIPGDPMMRTIVLRPNIYYSIRSLEKHLKQKVKDKSIKPEVAAKEMEHILEVALAIIGMDDTDSFESAVRKNKNNVDKQIEIFNQVKLSNIYN